MTDSSEAGANAEKVSGSSREIAENIWYSGNGSMGENSVSERKIPMVKSTMGNVLRRTASDSEAAAVRATESNAEKKSIFRMLYDLFRGKDQDEEEENGGSDGWGEFEGVGDFADILADAEEDGIRHLNTGGSPENIRIVTERKTVGMHGMSMTTGRKDGSILQKKIWTFSGENLISIHPTGIQKGTEHFRGLFTVFSRRKTLSIRTQK